VVFTYGGQGTFAGGNYVVNFGSGTGAYYDDRYPTDGLFWQEGKVTLGAILDGTSNTLLWSETLLGSGINSTGPEPQDKRRQMAQSSRSVRPNSAAPGGVAPPLSESICAAPTEWHGDRAISWIWGRLHREGFNTYLPINANVPDCKVHGQGWYAARSNHPKGVNVALADASVRFVQENVEISVWRAASTRASGEQAGEF
jgi:hypothetical protein